MDDDIRLGGAYGAPHRVQVESVGHDRLCAGTSNELGLVFGP